MRDKIREQVRHEVHGTRKWEARDSEAFRLPYSNRGGRPDPTRVFSRRMVDLAEIFSKQAHLNLVEMTRRSRRAQMRMRIREFHVFDVDPAN